MANRANLFQHLGLLLSIHQYFFNFYTNAQQFSTAAFNFREPEIYMWDSVNDKDPYNPYNHLTEHQKMLSEYVLVKALGKSDLHLIFYDPVDTDRQKQTLRKEYFWRHMNISGVRPGARVVNMTIATRIQFHTKPDDFIAFHGIYTPGFITDLQIPEYDIVVEVPLGSAYVRRQITVVEYSSFPLMRWRFGKKGLVTWETIQNKTMSRFPAFPYPENETDPIYQAVSPQDLRMLENPCARDLFAFYLIVSRRQDHSYNMSWGPLFDVYMTVPIVNEEHGPYWIDMTYAFCQDYPNDCGHIDELILTNAHLLAVSNRGIYVSNALNVSPLTPLSYDDLPLLSFNLIDPCSHIPDLIYCYTELGLNPLIHSIKLHYVPICYIHQAPYYRDVVALVISHDNLRGSRYLQNLVAWTVLWSEQPYTEWKILVKAVTNFGDSHLHSINAIYYNIQLDHFEVVAYIGNEPYAAKAYEGSERKAVRFVLPMPDKRQKPNYYRNPLGPQLGNGFLPHYFPNEFIFRKLIVSPAHYDVHYIGNQVWIANSGEAFVILSLPKVDGELEYCNFNHPSRLYICVNIDHTKVYVGKVGLFYRPYEINIDQFEEFRNAAIEQGFFIKPSSSYDSSLNQFINPNYQTTEGRVFQFLGRPLILKALQGIFFRVSYQGSIQIWYMDGGIKNEGALIPTNDTLKVKDYDIARRILESVQNSVDIPQNQDEVFRLAEEEVKNRLESFRGLYESKANAKKDTPVRFKVITIPRSADKNFEKQVVRPPLVPFFIDGITVALFQVQMTGNFGFGKPDIGSTINCVKSGLAHLHSLEETTCKLYISNVKDISDKWLSGFDAIVYSYMVESIPMHSFECQLEVHVNARSNDAYIYILPISEYDLIANETAPTVCTNWTREYPHQFVGWTIYIPQQFSVLITKPDESNPPDEYKPNLTDSSRYAPDFFIGKATTTFEKNQNFKVYHFDSFFVNMATIPYQDSKIPPNVSLNFEERYPSLPSYYSGPGDCLFNLQFEENNVMKTGDGVIHLDLQDSISFTVHLTAATNLGEITMQHVQLDLQNSNPKILGVRQNFIKKLTIQSYEITVKPTGFGKGQSTVTVRSLNCLPSCETPCSLAFIFQIMRAPGKRLKIHYPTKVAVKDILSPDSEGKVTNEKKEILYIRLPVNYRPPSDHGVNIPQSTHIYNADPSKPMYNTRYKISKVTGSYKQCRDKKTREECGCTPYDMIQDHPDFTDCKQMVYRVNRAREFMIRVSYTPAMDNAEQHQRFFLENLHLAVWVKEINDRKDYSLRSETSPYLDTVNSNKQLHRGRRFYDANSLTFSVHGTGVYHFRVSLGEFDSLDEISGYIVVYSEDLFLDHMTFLLIIFATLLACFLILFCGFLRVRKRLMGDLPPPKIEKHSKDN